MSVLSNYSNKLSNKIGIIQNEGLNSEETDYIVGDKVYIASNPEKTGIVTYNGTTKFSDGIWIGVALNQPLGKHNGVVQGVTYFQCEDKHGIFVRKNNLRHANTKILQTDHLDTCNEILELENQSNNSNLPKRSDDHVFLVPSTDLVKSNLVLGDRVFVIGKSSGSSQKIGTLRFIGFTKFAEHIWAGIELDNPVGKNDGSVDGVRYFSCKPLYGLFALENKVQKYNSSICKSLKNNNRMDNHSKFGSNESLSSIASNFSSASRTRVKLGMTAINTNGRSKAENKIRNVNSMVMVRETKETGQGTNAFQKVLKEKEQHVEQLIREREIERNELAAATSKIEELERQLSRQINNNNEYKLHVDKKIVELQENIILINQEKDRLNERLEEEKKKTDDLLFQIEEKNIDESDLENKTEESEHQIFELNEKLAHERDLRESIERKLLEAVKNQSDEKHPISNMEIDKLKLEVVQLRKELREQKIDSKVTTMQRVIEEKDAVINDIQDRYDNLKSKLEYNVSQIKKLKNTIEEIKTNLNEEVLKNLNLKHGREILEIEISELKNSITNQNEKINEYEIKLKQSELYSKAIDNENLGNNNSSEIIPINVAEIETLKKKLEADKKSISILESRVKSNNQELSEKNTEIMDLKQKNLVHEFEIDNQHKLKQSVIDERDKLCAELAQYYTQLEKLRTQISEMHNEKHLINDQISKDKEIKIHLQQEMNELKERIDFLERENQVLNDNLSISEEKYMNSNSTEMELMKKIKNLELTIQKLNVTLKSEKDEHLLLITKTATLYSELEHMKQNQDDFKNLNYEMENLQSTIENIETEKKTLMENYEVKNKELLIVRERLLKSSQEFDDLQESHKTLTQKLDHEKRLYADKIRRLEKQLDEPDKRSQFSQPDSFSDKRKSDNKDQVALLKTAKDNAEEQINFLNLVIGEREKKFKVLELENENLRNTLKDLENRNISNPSKTKKPIPPRLYCDVCEMFDFHDTDQCPIVADSSPQSSPVMKLRKPKDIVRAPRLYCDICEVFDLHNTSDCQDEQTF